MCYTVELPRTNNLFNNLHLTRQSFFFCNVLVRRPSSGSTILAHEQNNAQYTRGCLNTLPLHMPAILECSISAPLKQSYDINIKRNPSLAYSCDVNIKRNSIPEYFHDVRICRHLHHSSMFIPFCSESSLKNPVAFPSSSPLHGTILTRIFSIPLTSRSSYW